MNNELYHMYSVVLFEPLNFSLLLMLLRVHLGHQVCLAMVKLDSFNVLLWLCFIKRDSTEVWSCNTLKKIFFFENLFFLVVEVCRAHQSTLLGNSFKNYI